MSENNHEIKFVLNNFIAHRFIRWLQLRCKPDPEYPGGIVSSIYFDTGDWRFLREKLNSDFFKTKIRLRWYEDIQNGESSPYSFLEAKFKIGSQRKKVRIETGRSGESLSRMALDDGELLGFPLLLRAEGIVLRETVFPVFTIRYQRLRFIEPLSAARLSVDYNICVPALNRHMLPRINPFQLSLAVFEMKGDRLRLPQPLQQLTAFGCHKESFSKYSSCYEKIMGINS